MLLANLIYAVKSSFIVAGSAAVVITCTPMVIHGLERRKQTNERILRSRGNLNLLLGEIDMYYRRSQGKP